MRNRQYRDVHEPRVLRLLAQEIINANEGPFEEALSDTPRQAPTRPSRRRASLDEEPHNSEELGLYCIRSWLPGKQLDPDDNSFRVIPTARPKYQWFDAAKLIALRRKYRTSDGRVCYLVDFDVDHGEGPQGGQFELKVAPNIYRDYRATKDLMEDPETYARMLATIKDDGLRQFLGKAPPSAIWVTVAVVCKDGRFLAVHRSHAVGGDEDRWILGANETMKWSPTPAERGRARRLTESKSDHHDQTPIATIRRGLLKELGLGKDDYGRISVSWIGFYLPFAGVQIVAQVRSHLSAREIEARMRQAEEHWEIQDYVWLRLSQTQAADVIDNWPEDRGRREWVDRTPVCMKELWRMRDWLASA